MLSKCMVLSLLYYFISYVAGDYEHEEKSKYFFMWLNIIQIGIYLNKLKLSRIIKHDTLWFFSDWLRHGGRFCILLRGVLTTNSCSRKHLIKRNTYTIIYLYMLGRQRRRWERQKERERESFERYCQFSKYIVPDQGAMLLIYNEAGSHRVTA